MAIVDRIDFATAIMIGNELIVAATGEVDSSGWLLGRLSPRFYAADPADGIWDFDFNIDAPFGNIIPHAFPVSASLVTKSPPWVVGVRVHGAQNHIEHTFAGKVVQHGFANFNQGALALYQLALYQSDIAQYEDSWQPTGGTKIDWGGVHIEMKKLVHQLTLTIDGPDEQRIRDCFQQAAAAGLIAAIVAVVATGGAALGAAVSAFIATLENCLGGSFSVRIDDRSHWETWWT